MVTLCALTRSVEAQCSDGSPPPCADARQTRRSAPAMSVAVLGFRSISPDSGDALLGEGLAEELTSRLGQVERLTVKSRAAVRRLRNIESSPLPAIGEALNVSYLVQGSLRRAGERLRVSVELLSANGAVVWSDQFDRTDADMLAVQQDVGTAVAEAVIGRLQPRERSALALRPTRNADAYRAYLRGRARALFDAQREQSDYAIRDFREAVSRDSSFSEAWAFLSMAHTSAFWYYFDRSVARLDSARAAADRAERLAPNAAAVHFALGLLHYRGDRDYAGAMRELVAVRALDPNNSRVHSYIAAVARRQGNFSLALESIRRAVDLDPGNPLEIGDQALTLRLMRRLDEAEVEYRRVATIRPDLSDVWGVLAQIAVMRHGTLDRSPGLADSLAAHRQSVLRLYGTSSSMAVWRVRGPHQDALVRQVPDTARVERTMYFLAVGNVHASRGDSAAALASFDDARRLAQSQIRERSTDDLPHSALAQALAGLGRCDDALVEGRRAADLLPVSLDALTGPLRQEALAEIEAQCGRPESAVDRLTTLLTIPSNITPARLRADPAFNKLRGNPRFDALITPK